VSAEFQDRLQAALGSGYAIDRELGGGGMSRVYLARETALGREVVLKVLPPELTSSVNLERFRREIQYAAQLQHPHIVPLLNAGENDDLLWYTMPLIVGESLRAVLDRRGALPPGEVLQILGDVADALGAAHRLGLVHRDIKPENILIQGGHALVTDFGVAKAISASLPGTAATAVGVAVGTPAYMAPEQVAGDPAGDHRIDLYALGLLAYELLTGVSPFRGTSPHQTMAAHLTRQPTPPDAMRANLPPGLSSLVMRCLQKDPDQRYPDAAAVLQDLRRISDGEGRRIPRVPGVPGRRPPLRRSGSLAIGTAVVALALVAGYLLAGGGTRGAAPPAETEAAPADTTPSTAPPVLSFADSLAIADAVERELALQASAAATVTRAMLDSIRKDITATVTDSVRRASEAQRGTRGGAPLDPRQVEAIQRATDRLGQVGELLELAGRGGTTVGGSPGARFALEGPTRLMVLPSPTTQGSSWFALNQQELVGRVGAALAESPLVELVPLAGRADSLFVRGAPPEAVARYSNARFYLTMSPMRRNDSLGVTVSLHDLEAGSRQNRTLQVVLPSQAERSPGTVSRVIAARVTAAVLEMQGARTARNVGRSRPAPGIPPVPPVRPDSNPS